MGGHKGEKTESRNRIAARKAARKISIYLMRGEKRGKRETCPYWSTYIGEGEAPRRINLRIDSEKCVKGPEQERGPFQGGATSPLKERVIADKKRSPITLQLQRRFSGGKAPFSGGKTEKPLRWNNQGRKTQKFN